MKDNELNYDVIIDHALGIRDFEWVKELSAKKEAQNNLAMVKGDPIHTSYGILEDDGYIRKIREITEKEFIENTLVQLNKEKSYSGDYVNYQILKSHERWFIYGFFKCRSQYGYGAYYA